jgi:hypothetical protein
MLDARKIGIIPILGYAQPFGSTNVKHEKFPGAHFMMLWEENVNC